MDNARDYKARVEYAVNDATQTVYSFSFPYLRKKFVMAYVIHENDTITNLQYGVDYTVNNFDLILAVPLKENEHLVIYRQTTTNNIIQWNDGSILLSKDMNVSDIQQLHLQEEHDDFARANNMFVSSKNFELTWDALGHRITNVKDPKDSADVVTKHYMESVQDGFVQQNTALANTATEAAGEAKDSSDMAKKWAMSPVSPDGAVDTNSPTGYTQSAKEWALSSKRYLEDANSAFDGLLTENAWLGDMLGYGVAKGCQPSLTNNTIHIDNGVIVTKTGNKHRVSAHDFELIGADDTPRYDVIAVDTNGNMSYIKGVSTFTRAPQVGEATYQMMTQPTAGSWLRFGSIGGADLKPTLDSSADSSQGYFLIGSTIADTVQNLINVFNTLPTLSNKWKATRVEGEQNKFIIRENTAGSGNTPREFMRENSNTVPIKQIALTRSMQAVIASPALPPMSIPICTIRVEKNRTPILRDSRSIAPNASPNIANVKAYGAIGDGVFDDTLAIQRAFDTGKSVYFPAGTYRIDTMITRNKNNNLVIDASNAHILYTGTYYAFKLGSSNYSVFKFNDITALNGGGIWLFGDNTCGPSSYTDVWFKDISVETNGIYVTSSDWVWMNENYLHYGAFTKGDNGFYYLHNSKNGTSHWIFDHVSVEGVTRGFNLKQGDYAKANDKGFAEFEFHNGRYEENDVLLTVDGKATDFIFITSTAPKDKYLEYTPDCTDWKFLSSHGDDGTLKNGMYFYYGVYVIKDTDTNLKDLNNITTYGIYSVTTFALAATIKNSPITDMPFHVLVKQADLNFSDRHPTKILQIVYDWENRRKYTRMYDKNTGTWSDWKLERMQVNDVSSQITSVESNVNIQNISAKNVNGVISVQGLLTTIGGVSNNTKILKMPKSINTARGVLIDETNNTLINYILYNNEYLQIQSDLVAGHSYSFYMMYISNDLY